MKNFYVTWWDKGWHAARRWHRNGVEITSGNIPSSVTESDKYTDWRNGVTAYCDAEGIDEPNYV